MNRNKKNYSKSGNGKPYRKGNYKGKNGKTKDDKVESSELLDAQGRDNNPNWYFTDAHLAEQVSQLSFQNLAGYPIKFGNRDMDVPNMVKIFINPCPGVINSVDYNSPSLNKTSGINLAGFKLFSKISAYTGRVATYGPQDLSIMILAMGEIISCMEWIRRVFGVANAYSMRNRSYPREMLSFAFQVDDDDFFKNWANYRTRFNGLVTMVNQLPIPKGIAYFDKCASIYEKVYLDSPSSMAQTIVLNPFTTWILDETTNPAGSQLVTTRWTSSASLSLDNIDGGPTRNLADYLDTVDHMIGTLLNSSSLQVVYTDLLNLSVKVGQEFWKLDYLLDGYLVVPEYNQNMLLQMHNATMNGAPYEPTTMTTSPYVTAMNDVVPNANTNTVYYNPGFATVYSEDNGMPRSGPDVLIDMTNDNPTVEDRVECTRFSCIGGATIYTSGRTSRPNFRCDAILSDHYCVGVSFFSQDSSKPANTLGTSLIGPGNIMLYATYISNIDWAPRIWEFDQVTYDFTGNYIGDVNFYTVVDAAYLRKLHQFMALGLYDLRSGK